MIRVAMADDHAVVRQGLRRMLAQDPRIDVIGEACDGEEAVELVKATTPDVALLDITMPRKDGIQATSEIAALGLPTRVLVLSVHGADQYAHRALKAGATGFVSKTAPVDEILRAVADVAEGRRYVPAGVEVDDLPPGSGGGDDGPDPARILSQREFQVMGYLARGMTNREIAELLAISIKTVDTHRGHVLKKLRLRNNSDITRFAIKHGYIEGG